ncbi:MAG: phosphoglycerate kinase, partial [bacterium]|nr:phosphoglycerate kinase [bacterium]
GINIGETKMNFIKDRSLEEFIKPAKEYLDKYPGKIEIPSDLAFEKNGVREEISIENLPANEMFMDIGTKTVSAYEQEVEKAGTIFVNGPAGVYENELFAKGTDKLLHSIAKAKGYSVIGGGDTVSAAAKFVDLEDIDYVCTAGGAMVRFLSGKKLPLIEAMEKAYTNYNK